jgi:hypothetical protein
MSCYVLLVSYFEITQSSLYVVLGIINIVAYKKPYFYVCSLCVYVAKYVFMLLTVKIGLTLKYFVIALIWFPKYVNFEHVFLCCSSRLSCVGFSFEHRVTMLL